MSGLPPEPPTHAPSGIRRLDAARARDALSETLKEIQQRTTVQSLGRSLGRQARMVSVPIVIAVIAAPTVLVALVVVLRRRAR